MTDVLTVWKSGGVGCGCCPAGLWHTMYQHTLDTCHSDTALSAPCLLFATITAKEPPSFFNFAGVSGGRKVVIFLIPLSTQHLCKHSHFQAFIYSESSVRRRPLCLVHSHSLTPTLGSPQCILIKPFAAQYAWLMTECRADHSSSITWSLLET